MYAFVQQKWCMNRGFVRLIKMYSIIYKKKKQIQYQLLYIRFPFYFVLFFCSLIKR